MGSVTHCVGLRVHDPYSIPSTPTHRLYVPGLAPTTLADGEIDLSSRSTTTTRFSHCSIPSAIDRSLSSLFKQAFHHGLVWLTIYFEAA
jgi:hypothetical protein